MATNEHKVSKKQWAKWSEQAQQIFNSVYSGMKDNQTLFLHPKAVSQPPAHWRTTAWNAAWTAADAAGGVSAVELRKAA